MEIGFNGDLVVQRNVTKTRMPEGIRGCVPSAARRSRSSSPEPAALRPAGVAGRPKPAPAPLASCPFGDSLHAQ